MLTLFIGKKSPYLRRLGDWVGYCMYASLFNHLCGAVGIEGINLHAEALGNAAHVEAHVAESQDAQLLA